MLPDRESCRRARLARDPRFDGRFFIGVRTTGVFCRPVCPARQPDERNVTYFASAAAAREAGFRPCLRCRPECAPGSPAWSGSSATVMRALATIADGELHGDGVESLADRLGVGARHLRRLFDEHLGASPIAVMQTERLLSAKRLMDQTALPLTTIAMSSGFGSIRRFNAAFREAYGCSPRELRRGRVAATSLEFPLRFRPPLHWDALLGFFARRAMAGVENVEGGAYRRTIDIAGEAGWFEVRPRSEAELVLRIEFPNPARLLSIVSRVRRMFDLDADPGAVADHLARDTRLAPLIQAWPGLRVPGAWDAFEIGVRAIVGQQVSVAGARTAAGRLIERYGKPVPTGQPGLTHVFPSPSVLADANDIAGPAKRAEAIRAFALAAMDGDLAALGAEGLLELPGVGPWTAQYIAMRAFGNPDAFPAGDLVLLRSLGLKTARQMEARSEAWRPWRAYAAVYLWQGGTQ